VAEPRAQARQRGRAGLLPPPAWPSVAAEMGKRDETKFLDARKSAETELAYGLKPSSPPRGARLSTSFD
jgi:hypothetical protein